MNLPIESLGCTVEIFADPDPPNPRKEWDQFGRIATWHRRYDIGDEQPSRTPREWLVEFAVECGADPDEVDQLEPSELFAKIVAAGGCVLPVYWHARDLWPMHKVSRTSPAKATA